MATIHRHETDLGAVMFEQDVVTHSAARQALAALRIAYGLTFLWAFFDKLFALGWHTGVDSETGAVNRFGDAAWINGGSPTKGFLSGVSDTNWLHGFYTGMAGATWANWLFMIGLLGIGAALTFGIGIRIAAVSGALLYLLMWGASFPLQTNPVIDDHVIGFVVMVVLALTLAGDTWGFGKQWARTHLVRQNAWLR